MIVYGLCFVLFLIGLFGVLTRKNLIKMILGLMLIEYAINLFIVLLGYAPRGVAPFITAVKYNPYNPKIIPEVIVDPLPQAIVLISIFIGLSTLTLVVAICTRIFEKYKTLDITEITNLRE
jgi:multisubunit Na+/H+ antiporter MnhC subunit